MIFYWGYFFFFRRLLRRRKKSKKISRSKSTFLWYSFWISLNSRIAMLFTSSSKSTFGAWGGTRTHMVSRWILNPVRLPVPPLRHMLYLILFINFTLYLIILTYFIFFVYGILKNFLIFVFFQFYVDL